MAASTPSSQQESYTAMSKGDVEAIGAHCSLEFCRRLDLLPFRCESCERPYCLDHRFEEAHQCPNPGAWARKRNGRDENQQNGVKLPEKHSLLNHDQQCSDPSCKTLIDTPRMPASHCTTCNRRYCLKHRMMEDHNCENLKPIGARPMSDAEKSFLRLKKWAAEKRAEKAKKSVSGFMSKFKSEASQRRAQEMQEMRELKTKAKGEKSIPDDKRIYLYVEASADTTKAKFPTGKFFYNKEWSVGRILDAAAKALQVENVNNRGGGEEDKLRVFHVESGKLLRFPEKIGDPCATGNTIVLLRGVGDPDLIEL